MFSNIISKNQKSTIELVLNDLNNSQPLRKEYDHILEAFKREVLKDCPQFTSNNVILLESRFYGAKKQYGFGLIDIHEWSRTQTDLETALINLTGRTKINGIEIKGNLESVLNFAKNNSGPARVLDENAAKNIFTKLDDILKDPKNKAYEDWFKGLAKKMKKIVNKYGTNSLSLFAVVTVAALWSFRGNEGRNRA